jgi:hypothetical protein
VRAFKTNPLFQHTENSELSFGYNDMSVVGALGLKDILGMRLALLPFVECFNRRRNNHG